MSRTSRSAFFTAPSINRVKPEKTLPANSSYLVRLIVELKSTPSARLSMLRTALPPKLKAFFVASASNFSFAKLLGVCRGSVLFFFINSFAK